MKSKSSEPKQKKKKKKILKNKNMQHTDEGKRFERLL